jgi:hypothetical protein
VTGAALPRTALAIALLVGMLAPAACGGDAGARDDRADTVRTPSAAARPAPRYHVITVTDGGRVTGRVTVSGHPPRDTLVRLPVRVPGCGTRILIPRVERHGDRLAGAIVWLDEVTEGKPLPIDRRYELETRGCRFRPRVQAAAVGGMLNVLNLDRAEHDTRLTRGDQLLDDVHATDAGQVVPTPKPLAAPGTVEAVCAIHPWARAWIRVFDHPYFAETKRDGTFAMDSVPPGTYRLRVWQPDLGERDAEVVVTAGKSASVVVKY